MADYNYILAFEDYNGRPVQVEWFVKNSTAILPDYYFVGTGSQPATIRYHEGIIQGSELTVNLLIRNTADENEIIKLLSSVYYFRVTIDGDEIWYGENVNRFFNIAYKHFPYSISITASDRVGTLKTRNQIKISDYPDPDNKSLIYIFGKLLNFDDGVTTGNGNYWPKYINVATSIYLATQGRVFDEVFTALKNWLKEKIEDNEFPEYISAYEILEYICKAFNARLILHQGEWYFIDNYSYDSTGNIIFSRYDLQTLAYISAISTNKLVDLFASPKIDRFILQDQIQSFIPVPHKITFKKNLEPYKTLLPFANNEGNFYQLQDGVYLEFDNTDHLRNWIDGATFNGVKNIDGDGKLWVKITNNNPITGTGTTKAYYTYNFGNLNVNHIGFRVTTETIIIDKALGAYNNELISYYFEIKYTANGVDYWCNSNGDWDTSQLLVIISETIKAGKKDFILEFALPDEARVNQSLTITLYECYNSAIYNSSFPSVRDVVATIKGLKLYLIDLGIFESKFDENITEILTSDQYIDSLDIDLRFGIGNSKSTTNNDANIELSQCRDNTGASANSFTDGVNSGDLVDYWLVNRLKSYRQNIRKLIEGTIKYINLEPVSEIKDFEGTRYIMQEGTFDLKVCQFNGKFIETQR